MSVMSIRVVVVEDDEDLCEALCSYLREVGMQVRGLLDAESLYGSLAEAAADVVVLDVNLPGENGFATAARLRAVSAIGIVMLTARVREEDRLHGLTLGADHYLAKPVNLRELETVIRNLHRRVLPELAPLPTPLPAVAQQAWRFDARQWVLTSPGGLTVRLSSAEYHFLAALVNQPGEPVAREEVLASLNRANLQDYSRNLDTTLFRLRRKVEDECQEALPVRSARGIGYVFTGLVEVLEGRGGRA